MFLKRMEIRGFKSFADKVELELEQGITGVVGPNGSGKSNISDAVRWVLGEQSAKSLRGSKMEDIIFAGTDIRKPLGFAEVSITIDNSDNMLPIEYSEVTITRRMYRSGESEYYINRTSCRLKDITELFMDTGIGKDGYSIIGQGRVEEILNAKAEDRREIFEEAAGIVKYKTRKLESERKLENTESNITRIEDIINELDKQLGPLSQQSIKAKQYLELREKLKILELNLFISNVDTIKNRISGVTEDLQNLENELLDNNRKNTKIEEDYTKLKTKLQNKEKTAETIQQEIYTANNEIEKLQGEVNVLNEKKANIEKNIERLDQEIQKENDNIGLFNQSIVELNKKVLSFENILSEQTSLLNQKSTELDYINNRINDKNIFIDGIKSEIIEILNKISDKKSSINSYSSFKAGIDKRINQINNEIQENNTRLGVLNKFIIELESQISDQTAEYSKLESEVSEFEKCKEKIIENNTVVDKNIFELNGKIQSRQGRYKLLHEMESEFEGYNRSVKEIMRYKNSGRGSSVGICGVIADLIRVPKQYEIAIEIALGGALQNIVTEDEYTAKECIEFLKVNNYGRATFLPLTTIKGKDRGILEKQVSNLKGFVGFADKLISFDKKYDDIISNLLCRVVIADNMDNAIVIAKRTDYKVKIVTLDGDIINPGGAFTGGSISGKAGKILSRKREIEELERELNELNGSLVNMMSSKKYGESKLKQTDDKLKALTEQKHSLEITLSSISSKYNNTKMEIDKIHEVLKNLELELSQLKSEYDEIIKEIEKETLELAKLQSESNDLSSKAQTEQSSIKDILNKKEELMSELTSIQVKIAEYKQSKASYESKIEETKKSIENCYNSIKRKTEEKAYLNEQCKKVLLDIRSIEANIQLLNINCSDLRKKLDELNSSRTNDAIILDDMEVKKKEYNEVSASLQGQIHKLELQKARLDIELENLQKKIWDDYEISYASALKYKIEMDNMSQLSKDINNIKDTIKSLGPINVTAIDEYKEVKERYEFLQKQQKDLKEAKDSLNKVIEEMTEKMKVQFAKNFKIINNNFSTYFHQLFGGGHAELVLSNESDVLSSGIDIVAQPPGKKLQSLTLLSGGEKALTAIALLFAILKMKPSPFCILDEIEAALDDANISRFARFLRELSTKTQFIVITHRKGTMEAADSLYGVTMEEKGISRLVSVKLSDKAS